MKEQDDRFMLGGKPYPGPRSGVYRLLQENDGDCARRWDRWLMDNRGLIVELRYFMAYIKLLENDWVCELAPLQADAIRYDLYDIYRIFNPDGLDSRA